MMYGMRRKAEPTLLQIQWTFYPPTPYRHCMRETDLWWCCKLCTVAKWIAAGLNVIAMTRILTPVPRISYPKLASIGCDRHLCWVPGHTDIWGNEPADWAVPKALNCNVETCLIPHSDLKPLLATHTKAKWQLNWDESSNKLHEIKPSVGKLIQIYMVSQQGQIVLSLCRIGHL